MHVAAKTMLESFREKSGDTICKNLKGIGTGKVLCYCDDCVRHGVEVVTGSAVSPVFAGLGISAVIVTMGLWHARYKRQDS